jgi:hypothetical protein
MANVLIEYRFKPATDWSMMIAAPGESVADAIAALIRVFPEQEVEARERAGARDSNERSP